MAIAVDATSSVAATGNGTLTLAHTIGAGSDRVLYVLIAHRFSSQDVTAVTWNGVGLTLVDTHSREPNYVRVYVWRLTNPDTGAHNIVVTDALNRRKVVLGISLTGVDQTTPETTPVRGAATTNAPTVTVPSTAGSLVLDIVGARNDLNTLTATVNASQTERVNLATSNGTNNGIRGCGSSEAGAASVAMDWTLSASSEWAQLGFSVNAAAAGGGGGGGVGGLATVRVGS